MVERTWRVAAVSYINTLPFLHAIRSSAWADQFDIHTCPPNECARMYEEGEVDVALVPVGSLADMPSYQQVTDHCIASEGAVDTVALLTNSPRTDLETIYVDRDSRTSAKMIRLISSQLWNQKIDYRHTPTEWSSMKSGEGALLIGDKVKQFETNYTYKHDLGQIWNEWQRLPMVYAIWIAKPEVGDSIHRRLTSLFYQGMSRIDQIVHRGQPLNQAWVRYLTEVIKYRFDESCRQGLETFIQLSKQISC